MLIELKQNEVNSTTDPKFFTGWELLQVLLEMLKALTDLTINQKFVWVAGAEY